MNCQYAEAKFLQNQKWDFSTSLIRNSSNNWDQLKSYLKWFGYFSQFYKHKHKTLQKPVQSHNDWITGVALFNYKRTLHLLFN